MQIYLNNLSFHYQLAGVVVVGPYGAFTYSLPVVTCGLLPLPPLFSPPLSPWGLFSLGPLLAPSSLISYCLLSSFLYN